MKRKDFLPRNVADRADKKYLLSVFLFASPALIRGKKTFVPVLMCIWRAFAFSAAPPAYAGRFRLWGLWFRVGDDAGAGRAVADAVAVGLFG